MTYTVNPWMILPFGVLLLIIAAAPLVAPAWWLRHYPKVACSLGAITLIYYLAVLRAYGRVLDVGHEYVSFVVLIGSLFVVSGGIHINVKGEARPWTNVLFLFIGAVLANVLGTTGASMLLIRPWIRMNRYRVTAHHIVFFIFIVSNVGGCLTPIGDPPLFLGYLKGIPFWWVAEHCWAMWAVAVGYLLALFYVLDVRNYRRAPETVREQQTESEQWRFDGLWNLAWLAVILGAVFITSPMFLRELLMAAAAAGSYFTTKKAVHQANHFDFHPIQEVAILFIGIFATMIPALDWLEVNAGLISRPTPGLVFWGCGVLSSFLDNAPTYLSFLSAAFGRFVDPHLVDQVQDLIRQNLAGLASQPEPVQMTIGALQKYHSGALSGGSVGREQIDIAFLLGNVAYNDFIVAISVAAVFFGACTYIGNGPNFMVKSIADHQKAHAPDFLGLIYRYSIPCLIPLFLLIWLLFFR